jgi:predicted nucleic acid-binding Zn finger protein
MSLNPHEIQRLSKEHVEQSDIEFFKERYGKRFVRAYRAVEENRVSLYIFHPSETNKWTVKGRKREYLVIPETFCTCRDFYQAVVINGESLMCYHLLAQQIASIRKQHLTIESTDAERRKMYSDWRRSS